MLVGERSADDRRAGPSRAGDRQEVGAGGAPAFNSQKKTPSGGHPHINFSDVSPTSVCSRRWWRRSDEVVKIKPEGERGQSPS